MLRVKWKQNQGVGLIEVLIALGMVMIVTLSLAQLMSVTTQTGSVDVLRVEAINLARAKLEELTAIPYDQIGILPESTGAAKGQAYFETDPLYNPTYGTGDFLLSDTVEMSQGHQGTRTVTVEAMDHGGDDSGSDDWDQILDPNTQTILDFKVVTVTVETQDPISGQNFKRSLSTIVRGMLDEEIDGADGDDPSTEADGTATKKGKKKKASKKITTETSDHVTPEAGKKKKARKKKTNELET